MVRYSFKSYNPKDKTVRQYLIDTSDEDLIDPLFSYGYVFGNNGHKFYSLSKYPNTTFFGDTDYFELSPLQLPFTISKGLDSYSFICDRDGEKKIIGRHYWIVEFEKHIWNTGKGRQFKTLPRAIKFALKHYNKYLDEERGKIEKYECKGKSTGT